MSRKPLLFLHGALGAAGNFNPLIEKCDKQYECVNIEFPGHGNTPAVAPFSIEHFSSFLTENIAKRFHEPVSVFGYSMGGYIALHAACEQPNLFSRIMTLGTKFDWTEAEGKKQIAMLDPEKISAKIPHYAAYLSQLHTADDWTRVMKNTCLLLEQLAAHPPLDTERLAQLEIPICTGIGDSDHMVTLNETVNIYKQCKQGSLYVIPRMLHPIEKMNTELMYAHIAAFF